MDDATYRPLVSVVIPAYNQADYICDAVRSVLGQSYAPLEVIVVNDGSTDETGALLRRFRDTRLTVISHSRNLGLSAARNAGIRASHGELLAFLDADDYYHHAKVACHVAFLRDRPEIGVTYNPRFELNHSARSVRELWRPPATCGLQDLVGGFPFAPSDMVIRRDWLRRVGMFDEELLFYSEDLDINCRLALAGCQFGCVDRPLNYRRYHAGRQIQVFERMSAALRVVDRTCADPRCPADVKARWNYARASHLIVWAFCAFLQKETELGRECLDDALELNPALLEGGPNQLIECLLHQSMLDDSVDHRAVLNFVIAQFSQRLLPAMAGWERAAASGYFSRAVRAGMWGREIDAQLLFSQAQSLRAEVPARMIGMIATHLLNTDELMGEEFADLAAERISALAPAEYSRAISQAKACYFLNKSIRSFRSAEYREAMSGARKAVMNDLRYAMNRGLLSVSARSALRLLLSVDGGAHAKVG